MALGRRLSVAFAGSVAGCEETREREAASGSAEPRLLVEAVHAVEVLHGDAAGAADEVVLGHQDDDLPANAAYRQIEEIGVRAVLGRRHAIDDADEGRLRVIAAVEVEKLGVGERAMGPRIDRGEDA